MSRETSAIDRILAGIPDEIRFRTSRNRDAPGQVSDPKPVAPAPTQETLFDLENK